MEFEYDQAADEQRRVPLAAQRGRNLKWIFWENSHLNTQWGNYWQCQMYEWGMRYKKLQN